MPRRALVPYCRTLFSVALALPVIATAADAVPFWLRFNTMPADQVSTRFVSPLTQPAGSSATGGEVVIGDGPVIASHVNQADIEAGRIGFDALFTAGEKLFVAPFNRFDGQGRPATTGGGAPRNPAGQLQFLRTSGPEANSCAGCHNQPFIGGAGDNVANVFVLAQTLDPVTFSVAPQFSNERNTLGMQGSGAIEMLAREMSVQLQSLRSGAQAQARQSGQPVAVSLRAKGVDFGSLTAMPDGTFDNAGISGVNADLIVRPFHQKGAVGSLREFTNNAMNHHHGMQSVERFGHAITGLDDFDGDGVADELSVGDITAVTVFQAALAVPGQVFRDEPEARRATLQGERTFDRIGCTGCHMPVLKLDSALFVEPDPFNPPGNLRPQDVTRSYTFDLTLEGQQPRFEADAGGGAIVRAYTDIKRHNLCDAEIRHYCNELLKQAGIPTEVFLTRRLWDAGNSAPYGHRGDLTTLTDAIAAHGGEARQQRDAFMALSTYERATVIEFLKSLQMLPPGTKSLVVDARFHPLNKHALEMSLGE